MLFLPGNAPYFDTENNVFDEPGLRYFSPKEANYPTRVLCKALVLQLFIEPPLGLSAFGAGGSAEAFASLIITAPISLLGYMLGVSVFKCLHKWAADNGLPPEEDDRDYPGQWWLWVIKYIDTYWIATRVKQEFKDHGHRAGHRIIELNEGVPYKHRDV
jgi:hypothetical protein